MQDVSFSTRGVLDERPHSGCRSKPFLDLDPRERGQQVYAVGTLYPAPLDLVPYFQRNPCSRMLT